MNMVYNDDMVIEKTLNKLKGSYPLTELDIGEYAKIKKNGMKFLIHSYKVGDIGYLSVLNMSAMLGLMKMETVVFSPITIDVPLFSFDYIKALGNETLLVDIYDLCVNKGKTYQNLVDLKEKYKDLPNSELKPRWYDSLRCDGFLAKRGKKLTKKFEGACEDYLNEFDSILKNGDAVDPKAKRVPLKEYVDGLFDKGAPTTEQFNKILGEEKARDMYGKYIFFSVPLE